MESGTLGPADPPATAAGLGGTPAGELGSLDAVHVHQNDRGIRLAIDPGRNAKLTPFRRATLEDRYLLPGESIQDLFARVALHFVDYSTHAQRLYDYISKLWVMPATPVRFHEENSTRTGKKTG